MYEEIVEFCDAVNRSWNKFGEFHLFYFEINFFTCKMIEKKTDISQIENKTP